VIDAQWCWFALMLQGRLGNRMAYVPASLVYFELKFRSPAAKVRLRSEAPTVSPNADVGAP